MSVSLCYLPQYYINFKVRPFVWLFSGLYIIVYNIIVIFAVSCIYCIRSTCFYSTPLDGKSRSEQQLVHTYSFICVSALVH